MPAKPLTPEQLRDAARLKDIFEKAKATTPGLSQTTLAEACGWNTQATVSQYLNGKIPLNIEAAVKFAAQLRCRVRDFSPDLEEKVGDMAAAVSQGESSFAYINAENAVRDGRAVLSCSESMPSLSQPTEDVFAFVPQLDLAASCGHGRFSEHVVVKGGLAFKRSSLQDLGVSELHSRIIYAAGDSMEPEIHDGRVVLIDTADIQPMDNKIYLICDPDGAILLKKLVREFYPGTGDMRWIMRSTNPNKMQYPDKLLPEDDRTKIMGRAVWTDRML